MFKSVDFTVELGKINIKNFSIFYVFNRVKILSFFIKILLTILFELMLIISFYFDFQTDIKKVKICYFYNLFKIKKKGIRH